MLQLLDLGVLQVESFEFLDCISVNEYTWNKKRYEPSDYFLSSVIGEALLGNNQVLSCREIVWQRALADDFDLRRR